MVQNPAIDTSTRLYCVCAFCVVFVLIGQMQSLKMSMCVPFAALTWALGKERVLLLDHEVLEFREWLGEMITCRQTFNSLQEMEKSWDYKTNRKQERNALV